MSFGFVISAFFAGVLTFLAPCTLPFVPAYLGFISGVSLSDLHDKKKMTGVQWKVFLNGLFFVIGFSAVFIIFGTLAGFAGTALVPYRMWFRRIGGVFAIISGFSMLDVFTIPFFNRVQGFTGFSVFKPGAFNSFILGAAFAMGWTPCVGPILGSILFLASTSNTVAEGSLMLFVFSLGLAIPFLLIALGIGSASKYILRISPYLKIFSTVGGVFLILIGMLLMSNRIGFLIGYGYRLFQFINYEGFLKYL